MRERLRVFAAVARDPRLLRVQVAFFGFNMAEFATWVAILVFAYDRGGAVMAGLVAVIQLVPSALVAPFAAFAGDRFPRERVLLVDYLAQAAALAATAILLSIDASGPVIYVAASFAAISFTFTRPTQSSLLPSITRTPEDLTAANVVSGLSEGLGIFLGPLIAGVILTRSGPAAVFGGFAVVALLGALLVAGLRIEPRSTGAAPSIAARDVVREVFRGFMTLRDEPQPTLVILVLSSIQLMIGALDVLFVAAAIGLWGMGQGGPGFLNAAFGFGGILGAAAALTLVGRRRLTAPLASGSVLAGAPIAAAAATVTPVGASALILSAGAGRSLAYVAGNTLLQRVAPDEVLARVFGVLEGLGTLALAIGSLAASGLVAAFGVKVALAVVGAFLPVVVLLTWVPLNSIDRAAGAPDPALLTLIREIPMFAPLPPPIIERLVRDLRPMSVHAGEIVIAEGDVGDRYYVVSSGRLAVTRAGRPIGTEERGGGVGEIALLRDIPRTATVTALTDSGLLALDRDAFLSAVTGHPQSRTAADRIVTERLQGPP